MEKRKWGVYLAFLSVTVATIAFAVNRYQHLQKVRDFIQLLETENSGMHVISSERLDLSSFKLIFDVPKERFVELLKEKSGANVPEGWDRPVIVACPIIFRDGSHFYLYEKYDPPVSVAYRYTII